MRTVLERGAATDAFPARLQLEDLTVIFPYDYIYPEQYAYMLELKRSLDARGHCVLEMPSGTGKTVSLLALVVAYKMAHPDVGKLVYCSRTVPEIEKTLHELKRLMAYRERELGYKEEFTALGLSSRRNLCLNPEVSKEKKGKVVDAKCRNLTASWIRAEHANDPSIEVCSYYERYFEEGRDQLLPPAVYTLTDLNEECQKRGYCPYFLARHMVRSFIFLCLC